MSSAIWIWTQIPLLSVANNRSCCTGYTYNNIRRIQGTPHWHHQQPYLTLIPGKSPSKISEIEGISLYEQGYDAWGLRRELSVSDPGRYTKLPLEQRVLHIASPSHLLQRCWWKTPTLFPVSFQMTTHTTPVLFTRFRHYWWDSWSRDSQTSQRSIKFLTVVVGNIKISKTSLIYVPIKKTFPSKQSGFSLQLATGNLRVMELVVQWNTMLQNEVCRDHSTIDHDSGLSCGAGSMPGRNKINDLLWHWQRRHGRGEWEDGEEVQRW